MFASGMDDPVGDYFEGVQRAIESFKVVGMKDITVKKYETDRHELLNETDRDTVTQDIYNWLMQKVNAGSKE